MISRLSLKSTPRRAKAELAAANHHRRALRLEVVRLLTACSREEAPFTPHSLVTVYLFTAAAVKRRCSRGPRRVGESAAREKSALTQTPSIVRRW